ncbi:MAG: hypothetical protein H6621_05690 [Halobacteriovoraceae bacterium]|nr:hypothetical protein [Halobacteriovoraceae bacterium]
MKILLTLFALSIFNIYAGVNLKNGNYFVSYTDIVTTSKGTTLDVTRTYNSKSTSEGWFGYGWGTPYEVKLEVSIDGSIIIFENGTGGKTRFTPKENISKQFVTKSVDKIIAAVKKNSKLTSTGEKELRKKLEEDNYYRHQMAKAHSIESSLKKGSTLYSHAYGYQKIEVVNKGYKRSFESGYAQFFNKNGDLIATVTNNGYKVQLKRNKSGLVEKILDSNGNQIYVEWDSDKRIKSLAAQGKNKATYKYSGKDLSYSKDINNNEYEFKYDSHHNLVNIKDVNEKDAKKANIEITYTPKSFFATKVKKRGGDISEYSYESDSKNPELHYWTTVIKTGLNDKPFANKYEYEHKLRADGSQWLYRTKFITGASYNNGKIDGGIVRETVLNECCEQPVKIVQGKKVTEFKYKNGFMVYKKSSDGDFVKLEYHDKLKKITKVEKNDGWTSYQYNKKGELAKAVDSKGRAVLLVYDAKGKITKMVDSEKKKKKNRVLSFTYNSQGKPIEIAMEKIGKIVVKYDSFGQVKNVDSNGGRKIASQVTDTFQNLLEIVRPAGVNLSL